MSVPTITYLQFVVLEILASGAHPGRAVRSYLDEKGLKKSLASFYQIMARLEDAELVDGESHEKWVDGRRYRERWYQLTPKGKGARVDARKYYIPQSPMTDVVPGLQVT